MILCIPDSRIWMTRMSPASLLPQDVVVLAKLLTYADGRPSLARMAADLFLSGSQVHAALKRLEAARLVFKDAQSSRPKTSNRRAVARLVKDARSGRPNTSAAEEFLVHGVKYMFPAVRGGVTRGMLTSYAAPPLNRHISLGRDLPPVWPFAMGKHRGVSLQPLYVTVPLAAQADPYLYELLALLDALRDGRARERSFAESEIVKRLPVVWERLEALASRT